MLIHTMYITLTFLYIWFLMKRTAEIQGLLVEHCAFPFVIVWVWRGAWKLHPYNFVTQNCLLLPFWLNFNNNFLWTMKLLLPRTHADMLAFTVTLHQIHTQPYLYSLTSYTATVAHFLHLTHSSLQWEHNTHYYTNSKTLKYFLIWTTCFMIFSLSIFNHTFVLHLTLQHTAMHSFANFLCKIAMCHALLLQNCLRIKSVLTSSSSHIIVNLTNSKLSSKLI